MVCDGRCCDESYFYDCGEPRPMKTGLVMSKSTRWIHSTQDDNSEHNSGDKFITKSFRSSLVILKRAESLYNLRYQFFSDDHLLYPYENCEKATTKRDFKTENDILQNYRIQNT